MKRFLFKICFLVAICVCCYACNDEIESPEAKDSSFPLVESQYADTVSENLLSHLLVVDALDNYEIQIRTGNTLLSGPYESMLRVLKEDGKSKLLVQLDPNLKSAGLVALIKASCNIGVATLVMHVNFEGGSSFLPVDLSKSMCGIEPYCINPDLTEIQNLNVFSRFNSYQPVRNYFDSLYFEKSLEVSKQYLWECQQGLKRKQNQGLFSLCDSLDNLKWERLVELSSFLGEAGSFMMADEGFRPSIRIDQLNVQQFVFIYSSYLRWLNEKRDSIALLYFNESFHSLTAKGLKSQDFKERMEFVHRVVPDRLTFTLLAES